MKRCACVSFVVLVGTLCVGASHAHAQPAAAAAEPRMSVQFDGGPTLGHKSAGYVSGEFAWRLTNKLDVFIEAGHMTNVGTSALDDHAAIIANALGLGVGSTAIKVNHGDVGIKFNITPPSPKVQPYVALGVGF